MEQQFYKLHLFQGLKAILQLVHGHLKKQPALRYQIIVIRLYSSTQQSWSNIRDARKNICEKKIHPVIVSQAKMYIPYPGKCRPRKLDPQSSFTKFKRIISHLQIFPFIPQSCASHFFQAAKYTIYSIEASDISSGVVSESSNTFDSLDSYMAISRFN